MHFIVTLGLFILLFYQACSPTPLDFQGSNQESTSLRSILSSQNGTSYDGKITGQYFRRAPGVTCKNSKNGISGSVEVDATSAHLLVDNCVELSANISLQDPRLYYSSYNLDYLAINGAIFARNNGLENDFPNIEAWCHGQQDSKGVDAVIRSGSSGLVAQIHRGEKSASGQWLWDATRPFAVIVRQAASETSFVATATNFTLSVEKTTLTKSYRGQLNSTPMSCFRSNAEPAIAPKVQSLVGYWGFERPLGDVADSTMILDSTSFKSDGTAKNPDNRGMTIIDGQFGRALRLDGNDDFIDISRVAQYAGSNVTISAWFMTNFPQTKSYLVAANGAVKDNLFRFGFGKCLETSSPGELLAEVFNSTCYFSGSTPLDKRWHHAALTLSPSVSKLYLDGVLKDSKPSRYLFSPTDRWSIGQEFDLTTPGNFFRGDVDEIMIWNTDLSDRDIQILAVPTSAP